MDTFHKKIKGASTKIRMRVAEKRELREQILSYMEYHPLPEALRTEKTKRFVRTPTIVEDFFYINFKTWQVRGAVGAFALFLVIGVPFAAEQTVPGDVLYPVKVRVNEEVYSQLSLSSYEKVAWETRRVERRIAEARLLAKEGKLTGDVEAELTQTLKEHTATAQKALAELREDDADEAAVAQVVLESAFDVQSAVLETDHASSTEGEEQIRTLATTVRDAKATFAVDEQEPTLSSYERFGASVEESTTRAHEFFISIDSGLTTTERAEIQRRLEDIERRVGETKALYAASSTAEAIQGMKEALSDTQKLIAFMTDIDVRLSVSVETLVPKELTIEERTLALRAAREQVLKDTDVVNMRLAVSQDDGLNLKVADGLAFIKDNLPAIDAGIADTTTLEDAERAMAEVRAMMSDLLSLTESTVVPVPTPEVEGASDTTNTGTTTSTTTDVAVEEEPS